MLVESPSLTLMSTPLMAIISTRSGSFGSVTLALLPSMAVSCRHTIQQSGQHNRSQIHDTRKERKKTSTPPEYARQLINVQGRFRPITTTILMVIDNMTTHLVFTAKTLIQLLLRNRHAYSSGSRVIACHSNVRHSATIVAVHLVCET